MTAVADRQVMTRSSSWWLAVAMPLGPLAVGVLRYLLPYSTTDDPATMIASVAVHPGRESAVLWLGFVAVLTLIPGVLAAARLAGPTLLTRVALGMVVVGYLSLGALLAPDLLVWSGVQAGVDPTTLARMITASHPTIDVSTILFVVGHVLGTVLLGVGLLRARRIPSWAAWAIIVSQPLHFVAAVILGSHELDLFAWLLTATGMAVAARRLIVTESQSH